MISRRIEIALNLKTEHYFMLDCNDERTPGIIIVRFVNPEIVILSLILFRDNRNF
jgi:hypothetical protein